LDGWRAEGHAEDLHWLSDMIEKADNNNKRRVHLLCGDIHTGGLSKITFVKKQKNITVHQITSSPISYITMPPIVEKLTSGTGENLVTDSRKKSSPVICSLHNLFYRTNRNFVIIGVENGRDEIQVDYYFEDLDEPIKILI
jgi:hypothetical protein